MKLDSSRAAIGSALLLAATTHAANTGSPFYGDPPDDRHPWAVHDRNRPQPKRVEPGPDDAGKGKAPADAIILFDGTAESLLSKWESDNQQGTPTKWVVKDGAMECTPGSGSHLLTRKRDFAGSEEMRRAVLGLAERGGEGMEEACRKCNCPCSPPARRR